MPADSLAVARSANAEQPDPSYWTPYDHFMIEREARRLRYAYMISLVRRGWRALRARLAGAHRDDGRRVPRELSPRT